MENIASIAEYSVAYCGHIRRRFVWWQEQALALTTLIIKPYPLD